MCCCFSSFKIFSSFYLFIYFCFDVSSLAMMCLGVDCFVFILFWSVNFWYFVTFGKFSHYSKTFCPLFSSVSQTSIICILDAYVVSWVSKYLFIFFNLFSLSSECIFSTDLYANSLNFFSYLKSVETL